MKPILSWHSAQILLSLCLSLFIIQMANAAISTKQSGAWTAASTWEGNVVPTNLQDVIIKAGHTVTRSNAFVAQGYLYVYGTLVYQGNVARQFSPGWNIEIQGLLRMEGGTLYADGLVYGNGTFRQTAGSTTFGRAYVLETTDIQGGSVFFQNINNGNLHLDHLNLQNATLEANPNTNVEIKYSMNWNNGGKIVTGTVLFIEPGASLHFDGGNSTHYNDGTIENHGAMYCASGSITHINATGHIYNHGTWEFDVQDNATSNVTYQYVVNSGEILKKGPGSVSFSSSSQYFDAASPSFKVLQGGASITTSSTGHSLDGFWQVNANASLLLFASNTNESVPFAPDLFLNNGNVYGKVKFVGSNLTTLEGAGKYNKVEIAKTGNDVTLAGSPEITHTFTLTSGLIILNQYDLRLGTAVVDAPSTESYIKTNGLGSCVRYCPYAYTAFPVGNELLATLYIFMEITSVEDWISVRATDSFYGEYSSNGSALCTENIPVGVVGHNWFVEEQTPGGSLATVVLNWQEAAERNGFDRSTGTSARYLNHDWQPDPNAIVNTQLPFVYTYMNNVTSFGLFGVVDVAHEADVNFIAPAPGGNNLLCEWEDLQLFANTSPNADIQWEGPGSFQSSQADPIVADVRPSDAGIYYVTASQYGCPAQNATLTVQVSSLPTATVQGPHQTQAGEPVVLTAYGGVSYAWSTGDSSKSVTVLPTQHTEYYVTVTNAAGCTAVAVHAVDALTVTATSENTHTFQQIKLAPNPATASAVLFFESVDAGNAQLLVTDMRGITLLRQHIDVTSGRNQVPVSLENMPDGTYQITLIWKNELKTTRIVKCMAE